MNLFRCNGKEYTKNQIEEMSIEEINEIRADLQNQQELISLQLKKAKGDYQATGVSSDWGWYKRAETARAIMKTASTEIGKIKRQKIEQREEQREEQRKGEGAFYKNFYYAAEKYLVKEVFENIKEISGNQNFNSEGG